MAKILVVDDDNFPRTFVYRLIKRFGHEVFEAPGPDVAERMMHEAWVAGEEFRAVFTDLEMPHASVGRKFLAFLSMSFPTVKVVLMTSSDAKEVTEPYDCYLGKPFGQDQIREALERVLA